MPHEKIALIAFARGRVGRYAALLDHLSLPVASELNSHGPFFHALAALDFETLGCAIVALFVVGWAPSVLIWKYRRMEERWGS